MPVTNESIAGIPDYSDQELLKIYRKALVDIALSGQAYDVDGQTLTRANLQQIREMVTWLEDRIKSEDPGFDNGFGIIEFGTE